MNKNRIKKIIVIASEPASFFNFRSELIRTISRLKYSVTTISNSMSAQQSSEIASWKCEKETVAFSRNGLNPVTDFKTLFNLFIKFRAIQPDIILAYTIKPVIWGGLASRLYKTNFYALITGLGFAFQGESFKRKMLGKLVIILYRAALKNSKAVIFQNKDNRNVFIEKGIVAKSKTFVVNGSGVDLENYSVEPPSNSNVSFLCIARLLGEKGLREYAEAAKIVKNKFPNVEFNLVGPEDPSPDAILLSEVNSWSDYVNYKGPTEDVRPHIKDSHVYVLPSYHEGLPRSTLEAMSMGRPILTTNAVGCKETVEEGINGFMVSIGSTIQLAEKMIWYIENKHKIQGMGKESRRIVEGKFDVREVNKEMLRVLEIK